MCALHTPARSISFVCACQIRTFLWPSMPVLRAVFLSAPPSFGLRAGTHHICVGIDGKLGGEPAATINLHGCIFLENPLTIYRGLSGPPGPKPRENLKKPPGASGLFETFSRLSRHFRDFFFLIFSRFRARRTRETPVNGQRVPNIFQCVWLFWVRGFGFGRGRWGRKLCVVSGRSPSASGSPLLHLPTLPKCHQHDDSSASFCFHHLQ